MRTTLRPASLLVALALAPAGAAANEAEGEQKSAWRVLEILRSSEWALLPAAELLGAGYAESGAVDGAGGAGLTLKQRWAANRASYEAALDHEPFALRVFNFGDGEDAYSPERLTQQTDTMRAAMRWQKRWSDNFLTDGNASVSQRWAENPADERRLTEASWAFEQREAFGLPQASWTATARYGRSIYPQYRVADRALDSEWGTLEVTTEYRLNEAVALEAGYAVRSTQYLDAKYDAVDSTGKVTRSDNDKSLLRQTATVGATWRPDAAWKLTAEAELLRNDYSDYTRMMTGRDATGAFEDRLIRDYEDATRALGRVAVNWRPDDGWKVRLAADGWVRDYDTYQARNAGNRWLDETRTDRGIDLDASAEKALGEAAGFAFGAVARGSYDSQLSNMEREVSFATNYDITRFYLGVQVEGVE